MWNPYESPGLILLALQKCDTSGEGLRCIPIHVCPMVCVYSRSTLANIQVMCFFPFKENLAFIGSQKNTGFYGPVLNGDFLFSLNGLFKSLSGFKCQNKQGVPGFFYTFFFGQY